MRLTELEPRWANGEKTVLVFRCPHCRVAGVESSIWISCKSVSMSIGTQIDAFATLNLDPCGPRYGVVPMREDCAWTINGSDFETMTVTPSIDASAAGHWHGFITNGEIR